ncbi:VRR-NUC domain-containing protein [Dichotomopilus funicola]|uniref:Fanconi-associated nuclease n=1 Tax=Dichotomopilus funicola TaxID=1934379 RepID=A0AAN6ZM23_9PEZI|nr:VRR-NUC domain-containing protein [Dichotomopilus funicola]
MDRFIQRTRPRNEDKPPPLSTNSTSGQTSGSPKPDLGVAEPPRKRARLVETRDSEEDENPTPVSLGAGEDDSAVLESHTPGKNPLDQDVEEGAAIQPKHQTAFENSLPAIATDKEAIKEYEAMRASQLSQDDGEEKASSRIDSRKWVRGKSSIYVDAFNLALDTVLDNESHLFDDKEKCVFAQWRDLSYEAQYLYVRLFLRKAALWHRAERLGYHSDISDMPLAIGCLLQSRPLPDDVNPQPDYEFEGSQSWELGTEFCFIDDSGSSIDSIEEATSLLSLDELRALAKEAKVQGKNKGELAKAFCRASTQQSGLMAVGLRRSSTNNSTGSGSDENNNDTNRNAHFLNKIFAITGHLIRISEPVFKLFERVHLVFYRSTEWSEKSLTTIILAKVARRNYPDYIVCRSTNIFASRRHLLEFELSMRKEFDVDSVLEFNGPPGEEGFRKVLEVFDSIAPRWRELIKEENDREDHVYEFGEGGYLRRFNAGHAFTRIAHKTAHILGRLHKYKEEHELLTELLGQHLFHPARRGYWYQRRALLEERYMWEADPDPVSVDPEVRKKHWQRIAVTTCETALEDRDCHLIYHYDLQKRLVKLEKKLRVPRRLQHDFGHVKLREPEEHTVGGIQVVRDEGTLRGKVGAKTLWLDELGDPGEDGRPLEVSVEEMCLSHYRTQGWKGYHSEGGILRTLFAYLFFDVLFVYIPNVFQTAFQTCPLDLHTDAFYPARASQINHRLVEIANGGATRILREVYEREHERKTCVVGLNWDFGIDDLAELVTCFDGGALAAVCKVFAQEYKARGGGVPDLILWRTHEDEQEANGNGDRPSGEVMFAEVKSANDRLSDTQRLWINVLTGAGVRVALCNAVAREVRPG